MFDEHQKGSPRLDINPPVITIACAGGGLVLSFGLCGASIFTGGPRIPFIETITIALFILSLVVLLIGTIWLITVLVINAFRN